MANPTGLQICKISVFVYIRIFFPFFSSLPSSLPSFLPSLALIISPILHVLIQYTLFQPHQKMESNSLQIWHGLMMSLWTNGTWWKWQSMTSGARSETVVQLLPNSSGMLALGASRGHVRSLSTLRPLCWRGHVRHSRWQKSWAPRQQQNKLPVMRVSCLRSSLGHPLHGCGLSQHLTTNAWETPSESSPSKPCSNSL